MTIGSVTCNLIGVPCDKNKFFFFIANATRVQNMFSVKDYGNLWENDRVNHLPFADNIFLHLAA